MQDILKSNTPAFVFDTAVLQKRAAQIREIVGETVSLCYSMKANPFLVTTMLTCVDKLEVCSPGELAICKKLGVDGSRIIYSGVNKGITDIREAYELGIAGVKYAIEGNTGFIPVLKRISDAPYRSVIEYADLKSIANVEKKVPLEWINKAHNNVTDNMLEYVKPLINGEIMLPYKNGLPDHLWQDTKYMD